MLVVIVLVLGGAGVALFLWMTPSLVEVSPLDGEVDVRAGSPVRLVFSRSMDWASVEERLSFKPQRSGTYDWEGNTLVFVPDQPWPNGESVTVKLSAGAVSDSLLPIAIREENESSFQIGQPRLAYLYPSDGPANIFAFNTLTGQSEQLTDLVGIIDYHVYLNGNAIYFSRRSGSGGSGIYRFDLDGGDNVDPVLVVDCPGANCRSAQVSPEGDYLAYERTAFTGGDAPPYPQVWLLPLIENPSQESGEFGPEAYLVAGELPQTTVPHWSPDGLLTYYDYSREAFVIHDPETGEEMLLSNQTGQPGDWHPGGEAYLVPEIFFVEIENTEDEVGLEELGSSHLLLYRSGEETPQDLTRMDYLEDTAAKFSPLGQLIAFARKYLTVERWTPGRQLWVLDTETGETRQLTNEPFYNHYDFSWSPSGDVVAFVRFNQTELTEPPELWVIDPLTGQATSLVEGGFSPQWIP